MHKDLWVLSRCGWGCVEGGREGREGREENERKDKGGWGRAEAKVDGNGLGALRSHGLGYLLPVTKTVWLKTRKIIRLAHK